MGFRIYPDLFSRLVANTADPENDHDCWIWTGDTDVGGYPRINVRVPGKKEPVKMSAHRLMLQEFHQIDFPFDEAGHLCNNPPCINPCHLEVQSPAFNLSERRGYAPVNGKCLLPTVFPRVDRLQQMADWAWDTPGLIGGPCPF